MGFPARRVFFGITDLDSVSIERIEPTSQSPQLCVAREKKVQQYDKFVSAWRDKAPFLEERFEILLGSLLAVKADQVIEEGLVPIQDSGADDVGLGFADPARRQSFHK